MITALKFLTIGRNRIAQPEHWCQGDYAQDMTGRRVASDSPEASKFCMLGAFRPESTSAGMYYPIGEEAINFLNKATTLLTGRSYQVVNFNDDPSTTHEDALAVYDKAIELAQEAT